VLRILTLIGWVVGNPLVLVFLSPEDRDMYIISMALVVGVVVALAVVQHHREVRR